MEKKPVELSILIEEFTALDQFVERMTEQNKQLEIELELKEKENEIAKEREQYLLAELKAAKELVSTTQNTLSTQCNLEDENIKLKSEIQTMKERIDVIIKENEDRITNMEAHIEALKQSHVDEINKVTTTLTEAASEEKTSLTKALNEKSNEVSHFSKRLMEAENEHQSEIMKLRLEYDQKILSLQKQVANMQNTTTQISTSKRDIFRQKLNHQKAESEREIANLKKMVSQLQSKLEAQTSKCSLTNKESGLSLTKRKKY